MARRDNSDPSGLGQTLNWGFAWPVNRRILYNRASADPSGKPWDPKRTVLKWLGDKWGGNDVPDMRPDSAPEQTSCPFIMTGEGVGRLFARRPDDRRPVPRALRALRVAAGHQPDAPEEPEGHRQPGGPGVQGRHGSLRHGQGLPVRRPPPTA